MNLTMADIVYPGDTAGGPLNAGAMPANYDLNIYQGDALKFTVTVKDASNAAVNLTGSTAKAQLKAGYSDSAPVDFVCTVSTPASGIVTVYLAPTTTAALDPNKSYIWDFQVTETGGDVRTYLAGDATVIPEVTK